MAANAATGDSKWPGVLDLLRTRAWWAVGVLTLAAIVIAWLVARAEQAPDVEGDPPSASGACGGGVAGAA
ncbi:hypothetical protein ACIG54_06990 [Streptomyces achromogenes]|uniref:hypothetical protein n=1 Tax=Streptomyces achromogenes TaxID=67255 RepID=UPI0037D6570F